MSTTHLTIESSVRTLAVRVEPWPGRAGAIRSVALSDGSFSAWIPQALRGLGLGVGRLDAAGNLVEWIPASAATA